MTADELVCKRCRDREDYYSSLRSYERTIAEMSDELSEKDAIIAQLEQQIVKLKNNQK